MRPTFAARSTLTCLLLLASAAVPAKAAPPSATQRAELERTSGRALEHLQRARSALDGGRAFDAAQELVRARTLLGRATDESPSGAIHRSLDEALRALDDPSTPPERALLDDLFAALDAAGELGPEDYTRHYAERARYALYLGDRQGALRELTAAAARAPYGTLDAPLAACLGLVNRALIAVQERDVARADALLASAEHWTQGVTRLAGGREPLPPEIAAPPAPGVASPPPLGPPDVASPPPSWAPQADVPSQSEIRPVPEFQEYSEPIE